MKYVCPNIDEIGKKTLHNSYNPLLKITMSELLLIFIAPKNRQQIKILQHFFKNKPKIRKLVNLADRETDDHIQGWHKKLNQKIPPVFFYSLKPKKNIFLKIYL